MKIVWDEPKRLANLAKHQLDFATLDFAYFLRAVVLPGHSGRMRAVGVYDGVLVKAVIFVPLGSEAISVISMRPANPKERRHLNAQAP